MVLKEPLTLQYRDKTPHKPSSNRIGTKRHKETKPLDQKLHSTAAVRNCEPVWSVLSEILPERGTLLEIGSGTGQHGAAYAPRAPHIQWQPSDIDPRYTASVRAHQQEQPHANWLPPIHLDVTSQEWDIDAVDVIMSMNMIHIAPWEACVGLLQGAGKYLVPGGWLYTYGPYKIDGEHTSESNVAFDRSLKSRNPSWGIKDLEAIVSCAEEAGLRFDKKVAMPASNFSLLFQRGER